MLPQAQQLSRHLHLQLPWTDPCQRRPHNRPPPPRPPPGSSMSMSLGPMSLVSWYGGRGYATAPESCVRLANTLSHSSGSRRTLCLCHTHQAAAPERTTHHAIRLLLLCRLLRGVSTRRRGCRVLRVHQVSSHPRFAAVLLPLTQPHLSLSLPLLPNSEDLGALLEHQSSSAASVSPDVALVASPASSGGDDGDPVHAHACLLRARCPWLGRRLDALEAAAARQSPRSGTRVGDERRAAGTLPQLVVREAGSCGVLEDFVQFM